MTIALETVGLEKHFGGLRVTRDLSLKIARGARHALIGPNGAGKTTVINQLTGVLKPNAGRILLEGQDITDLPVHKRVLLLDEPAAGVPESERHDILAVVAALPRDVTVLLIEHDMDLVFSFADRISVLVSGALLTEGPPDQVAKDPQVKAVYLGEAADA